MNCSKCIDMLSEYLDNEINEQEQQEVEAHLMLCSECNTLLWEFQAVNSNFHKAISNIPVPAGLDHKILASIEAEQVNSRRQAVHTTLVLILVGSPLLLLFSSIFSSFAHWLYVLQSALWRTAPALVQVISPWTSIGIGIITIPVIIIGTFFIKKLLRDIHINEVFS